MKLDIIVNKYLLIWHLLYQSAVSEEIHNLKLKIWTSNKKEYSLVHTDKAEILNSLDDFIPDDDIIYNLVENSPLYKRIKIETNRYRNSILEIWDQSKKKYSKELTSILKFDVKKEYKIWKDAMKTLWQQGNSSNQGIVKQQFKNPFTNEVMIPWSTIKGILRTAYLYDKFLLETTDLNNAQKKFFFPTRYGGKQDINVIEPLYDYLKHGQKVKFKIKSILDEIIIIDNEWHYLKENIEGYFEFDKYIQTQKGNNVIIGKKNDTSGCDSVVSYKVI